VVRLGVGGAILPFPISDVTACVGITVDFT
jgi:hypothetical protein